MALIERHSAIVTLSSPALICASRQMSIIRLNPSEIVKSYAFLSILEHCYPEFRTWFVEKLYPGCYLGKRAAFACVNDTQQISGMVIAKRDKCEKKISTLFVGASYSSRGIGTRLLNTAMAWLEDIAPIITVDQGRLKEFDQILISNGFRATSKIPDLYRIGRVECIFNEKL